MWHQNNREGHLFSFSASITPKNTGVDQNIKITAVVLSPAHKYRIHTHTHTYCTQTESSSFLRTILKRQAGVNILYQRSIFTT